MKKKKFKVVLERSVFQQAEICIEAHHIDEIYGLTSQVDLEKEFSVSEWKDTGEEDQCAEIAGAWPLGKEPQWVSRIKK